MKQILLISIASVTLTLLVVAMTLVHKSRWIADSVTAAEFHDLAMDLAGLGLIGFMVAIYIAIITFNEE